MEYVADANTALSGLIADSTTRKLLVETDNDLLTLGYVYDEIETCQGMVVEKLGLTPAEVEDLVRILCKRINVVSRSEVLSPLRTSIAYSVSGRETIHRLADLPGSRSSPEAFPHLRSYI